MGNRRKIAKEFAQAINSTDIIKIILFGSVARGGDGKDSDIDILIIIRKNNPNFESMVDKKVVDFILETEEVISPHVMTLEHFNKTKEYSFLQNVMADGVILYEVFEFDNSKEVLSK